MTSLRRKKSKSEPDSEQSRLEMRLFITGKALNAIIPVLLPWLIVIPFTLGGGGWLWKQNIPNEHLPSSPLGMPPSQS